MACHSYVYTFNLHLLHVIGLGPSLAALYFFDLVALLDHFHFFFCKQCACAINISLYVTAGAAAALQMGHQRKRASSRGLAHGRRKIPVGK